MGSHTHRQRTNVKAFLSKRLVIAATGLVVLAGAAGAVAATQGSSGGAQAYTNDLAGRLGVTPSALTAAIKASDSDRIDAALAAGRLTQAQATALKARIQASAGVPFFGHHFAVGGFTGRLGGSAVTAAQYLGISDTTLHADLQAGQSLAQIATATPDKSVAGLKAAIVAAETTRLNAAVSAGRITSQQEQRRLANLSSRIDALVQRAWNGGGAWAGGGRGPALFGPHPTA
jgi:hypothetical protein